jgi:hypothetical protein
MKKNKRKPEMKCEKAVKRVMKQKNLTPEKAVSKQIWRKQPRTRCSCAKRLKMDRQIDGEVD